MSYVNLMMYGSILPSYDSKKDKSKNKDDKDEIINADDPANKQRIRHLLYD